MHKRINCYGKFGLLTKNLVYLVCFATGLFALSQNVLAYYSGVAVQWNDKYSLHCLILFNIRKFCQENNCSLRSFLSFKPRQPQLLINQFIIKKSVLYATYCIQYAIKRLLNMVLVLLRNGQNLSVSQYYVLILSLQQAFYNRVFTDYLIKETCRIVSK